MPSPPLYFSVYHDLIPVLVPISCPISLFCVPLPCYAVLGSKSCTATCTEEVQPNRKEEESINQLHSRSIRIKEVLSAQLVVCAALVALLRISCNWNSHVLIECDERNWRVVLRGRCGITPLVLSFDQKKFTLIPYVRSYSPLSSILHIERQWQTIPYRSLPWTGQPNSTRQKGKGSLMFTKHHPDWFLDCPLF